MVSEINKEIEDAREILDRVAQKISKTESVGPFTVYRIPNCEKILLVTKPKKGTTEHTVVVDEKGLSVIKEMDEIGYNLYSNQKGVPTLTSEDKNKAYRSIKVEIAIQVLEAPDNKRIKVKNKNQCDLRCSNITW